MERRLKERLIGAAVLVMLVVIFIPMILDDSVQSEMEITKTNIPDRPATNFNSRIIPIEEVVPVKSPVFSDSEVSQASEIKPASPEDPIDITQSANAGIGSGLLSSKTGQEKHASSTVGESESRGLIAWVVQLGSFSNQDNANALVKNLRDEGYSGYAETINTASGLIYRVRVGPELLKSDAEKIQMELNKQLKFEGIVLRYP